MKYRIVWKGHGRTKYRKPEAVRGTKLKELEQQGVELYDTEKEARANL